MKRLYKIPAYRHLLLAYGLNELAGSVAILALSFLIYRRTGSALGSAAFFLCSQIAPALLSPVLVSRIDQLDVRRILPGLYVVEAVIIGVLAWMTEGFVLPLVLFLVVVDGSIALVARTLSRAATTEVLRRVDLLHEGNALTNLVFAICYMAAPIIGGVVVATGGTAAALLVNCALFLLVGLVLITAVGLPGAVPEPDPVKHRLRSAVGVVRGDRALRTLLTLQAVGTAVFTIAMPVEVVLAEHTLHSGAAGYGALLSGWGAGAIAGSFAYARWRRRSGQILIALSAMSLGIGFTVMAVAPTIVVAVIGGCLAGVGNGSGLMAAKTMTQEYTPQRWMAMVIALNEAGIQAAPGVGIIIGGAAAAAFSARLSLGLGAVASLTYAGVAWLLLSPSALPPPPEPHAPDNEILPIDLETRETLV